MTGRVKLFLTLPFACFLVNFVTFCVVYDLTSTVRKNGENRSPVYQGHRPVWALHLFLHSNKGYYTFSLLDQSHTYSCRYAKALFISVISDPKSNLDHYISLKNLPEAVANTHVRDLQPYITFILSCLWKDQVFFILPRNELGPLNPRDLPRELFAHEGPILDTESGSQKRKGRPTRRETSRKARAALQGLDEWIAKPSISIENGALYEYQLAKSSMTNTLAPAMDGVNAFVLERLRAAQESFSIKESETDANVGVLRIEKAIERGGWGILGLLQGADTMSNCAE